MQYLFGPVPSRRLGMSLGVDLVPKKICTLNCVYCECGKTPDNGLVVQRKEYVPTGELLQEIDTVLKSTPQLDYITLTGSGEPTLNNKLPNVIHHLRTHYPQYKIALLTNGTLLYLPEVQREILDIDVLVPSLDAVREDVFAKINKPNHELKNTQIIEGLISFSQQFKGKIWLELFIVPGMNDHLEELTLIKEKILQINPEVVHINAVDRPPAFAEITKPTEEKLKEIKEFLKPLKAEIVVRFHHKSPIKSNSYHIDAVDQKILAILKRRPSTLVDLTHSLQLDERVIIKHLELLLNENLILAEIHDQIEFFLIKE
ncbi:MAG: radical SAM protein [Spirochaetes bacterium]|nr:radical SAM protein [Spirochaetota bacterium]